MKVAGLTDPCVIVSAVPPELVTDPEIVCFEPTVTLPKLNDAGCAVSCPGEDVVVLAGAVAVPLTFTCIEGVVALLLEITIVALLVPTPPGAYLIFNRTL